MFLNAGGSLGRELQTLLWLLPVSNEEYASSIPLQQLCCNHTLWAYAEVNSHTLKDSWMHTYVHRSRHSYGRFPGRRTKIKPFQFRYFCHQLQQLCLGAHVDLPFCTPVGISVMGSGTHKIDILWAFLVLLLQCSTVYWAQRHTNTQTINVVSTWCHWNCSLDIDLLCVCVP